MYDPTKPIIVNKHGDTVENCKSLAEAKRMAKQYAEEENEQFVVCVPHTSFAPQKPPIKAKRHKIPK